MKVQSTGLGKTVMEAQLKGLSNGVFDGESVVQVNMESFQPLHWTIKVYMGPKDLRKAIFLGMKPRVMWRSLLSVIFGRFTLFPRSATQAVSESQTVTPSEQPTGLPASLSPASSEEKPNPLARFKS